MVLTLNVVTVFVAALFRIHASYYHSCMHFMSSHAATTVLFPILQFSLHVYEITIILLSTSAFEALKKTRKLCTVINISYNFPTFSSLFGIPPPFPITTLTMSCATKSNHCNFSHPAHQWPQDSANRSHLGLAASSILMTCPCHLFLHPSS
jgi:hypothetical protein